MPTRLRHVTTLLSLTAVFALATNGCGDTTSSVGELGRLRYSLYTDYEVPDDDLVNATIVTGHRQTLWVTMTRDGRHDMDHPEQIEHFVEPSDGVTIVTHATTDGNVPEMDITVTSPGTYKIKSKDGDDLIDRIKLTFDTPAGFDLLLKLRAPYAEDFENIDDSQTTTCVEGSQITIDAAPLDSNGDRLAGQMQNRVSVTPEWMAVPGVGIIESYEDGVWAADGQANVYFVEPGSASIDVEDPVSNATSSALFVVTPIPKD